MNILVDDRFVKLQSIKQCKLALICVCDKADVQEKIKQKLLDNNIDINKIKIANFIGIRDGVFSLLKKHYLNRDFLEEIKSDDFYMTQFLNILKKLSLKYINTKKKEKIS
ncbi:hypothetical protein [Helicobacter ibis]|uniref:Uncharacterized protein n=1 Tax=Helicobacter ibis TaxID=2962633 RepID=A0ABT4VFA4_9HELI|nr:hypothetical protein [Helicobacter ibis]MDA3969374.1 hypothetical protein [Helicobacter ibis]